MCSCAKLLCQNVAWMTYLRQEATLADKWPVENIKGLNMMTQAAIKNNFELTKMIVRHFNECCSRKEFPDSPTLCELINAKNVYGNSSLHYYALRGNHDAIKQLCSWGGSIMQKNRRGQRPIDILVTRKLDFQEHDGISVTFTPEDRLSCKVVAV